MKQFFGIYRAIVTNAGDPENVGRIQVRVPSVTAEKEIWAHTLRQSAKPFVPAAGSEVGTSAVPAHGSNSEVASVASAGASIIAAHTERTSR